MKSLIHAGLDMNVLQISCVYASLCFGADFVFVFEKVMHVHVLTGNVHTQLLLVLLYCVRKTILSLRNFTHYASFTICT